jgi:hypothetical protein
MDEVRQSRRRRWNKSSRHQKDRKADKKASKYGHSPTKSPPKTDEVRQSRRQTDRKADKKANKKGRSPTRTAKNPPPQGEQVKQLLVFEIVLEIWSREY